MKRLLRATARPTAAVLLNVLAADPRAESRAERPAARPAEGDDYLASMVVLGLAGSFVAALLAGVGLVPVVAGGLLGGLAGLLLAE